MNYNNESFVMQPKFIPNEKHCIFDLSIHCESNAKCMDERGKNCLEFVIHTMLLGDFIYLFLRKVQSVFKAAGSCKCLHINESGSEAENPCISHRLATRLERSL